MKRYIRFLAVFCCNYGIIVKFINWCVILLGMSKIEVVIWDLGNVLIGSNMDRIVENFSQISGLNSEVVDGLLFGRDITMRIDTPFYNFLTGKITSNEFYNQLRETFQTKFSYRECIEAWENNFYPMGGMINLYQQVAERFPGVYELGVVGATVSSNGDLVLGVREGTGTDDGKVSLIPAGGVELK